MGKRRQTQKVEQAWSLLAQERARMMAMPVGERAVSLVEVEQQAVRVYDESHSYYRQPASRRVMHAAAVMAHRLVEQMEHSPAMAEA